MDATTDDEVGNACTSQEPRLRRGDGRRRVDRRMNLYGGAGYSFTNPAAGGSNPALAYEPKADARSWRAMLDLFTEQFGEPVA